MTRYAMKRDGPVHFDRGFKASKSAHGLNRQGSAPQCRLPK
jgi:hypothetical protein